MIRTIASPITRDDLRVIAKNQFGDFVKAVVDIAKGIMAIGGELHADEEAILLEQGSVQDELWGVNLYPDIAGEEWIEFNSMINIRPAQHNRSRGVENRDTQEKIRDVVGRLISP